VKRVTVEIYSGPSCAPCVSAKRLIAKKAAGRRHITILDFDVKADPARCAEMIARAGGRKTIPQIFINGVHVGGSDELVDIERSGKLDTMLRIA